MYEEHYVEKIDRFLSLGIKLGSTFFPRIMSGNCFCKITRFFRLDVWSTKLFRPETDKFGLIIAVWDKFVENCIATNQQKIYYSGQTIVSTKVCCRCIRYMANKPDKFGIKFWSAFDVEFKYIPKAIPYFGKDDARPAT